MTTKTYIEVEGQTLDPDQLTLPASRDNRDAWVVSETDPNVIVVDPVKAKALMVPASVTKINLKRACKTQENWGGSGMNLWEIAMAALATQDADTREDWDLSTEIPRDDPLFLGLASGLGVTEDQIDDIFILAATYR